MPNVIETLDAAGSTATTYAVSLGDIFMGTLGTGSDTDWVRVDLVAGAYYQVMMNGSGPSPLGDAFLQLRSSTGALIKSDDNGGFFGLDAALTFRAPATGTFYIAASSADGGSGSYTMSVTEAPPPAPFTNDQIARQLTDGFWDAYGLERRAFNIEAGGTLTVNLTALTADGIQLARWALTQWTSTTGIQFQEVTGPTAQIVFDDEEDGAYTTYDAADGTIASAFINVGLDWLEFYGVTRDTYSLQTYIHEIGHALGLGHAGNYNGDAIYGIDELYPNDSWQATVMSYFNQDRNTYVDADLAVLLTPMPADILAVQTLYGAVPIRAGDGDVYSYQADLDLPFPTALTIVDTGGIDDTIDFGWATVDQKIDLTPEAYSDINGTVGNVAIARGTIIERVFGGSARDRIIGNGADNYIDGGAGADAMAGGAGNDTYVVDNLGDTVEETDLVGFDTINASVSFALGAASVERLVLTGTGSITGTGNGFSNQIFGNVGNNILDGGGGDDLLHSGGGADTMYGGGGSDSYHANAGDTLVETAGQGTDRVFYYAGANFVLQAGTEIESMEMAASAATTAVLLTGNEFGQTIRGNAGANTIDGRGGADSMWGLGGDDIYGVDNLGDRVYEANIAGYDTVYSSVDFALGGQYIEALVLTGAGNATGNGNTLNNAMTGNAGNNVLGGGAGIDRINGGLGNDTLYGGTEADYFYFMTALGPTNVDTLADYNVADDTILLDNAVFTALGLATGGLAASAFLASTAGVATTASQRIIYDTDGGQLYYDADGNGAGAAIRFAQLSTGLAITNADFAVI